MQRSLKRRRSFHPLRFFTFLAVVALVVWGIVADIRALSPSMPQESGSYISAETASPSILATVQPTPTAEPTPTPIHSCPLKACAVPMLILFACRIKPYSLIRLAKKRYILPP